MSEAVDDGGRAVRRSADGVDLRVRLTPKASRDALGRFERLGDGHEVMLAHVRALPADGAANAALTQLVAKAVGVAKTKVEVVAGHTSRVKTVRIQGDATAIADALQRSAATVK
jgi:uncharacterized protein (TIGR00251 family)